MVGYIISFVIILVIAIVFRVVLYKNEELKNAKWIFEVQVLFGVLVGFVFAYFITDTWVGLLKVGISLNGYTLLYAFNYGEKGSEISTNVLSIIILPIVALGIIESIEYVIAPPYAYIWPSILIVTIFWASEEERKLTFRNSIFYAGGIALLVSLIFFTSEEDKFTMSKIEEYAEEYLVEQGYESNHFMGNLYGFRGEKVKFTVYGLDGGDDVEMIYQNDAIISYVVLGSK